VTKEKEGVESRTHLKKRGETEKQDNEGIKLPLRE